MASGAVGAWERLVGSSCDSKVNKLVATTRWPNSQARLKQVSAGRKAPRTLAASLEARIAPSIESKPKCLVALSVNAVLLEAWSCFT